jgi:hypothetical protein
LTLAAESLIGGFVRCLAACLMLTVAGLFLTLPFAVETGAWAVAFTGRLVGLGGDRLG